MKDTKHSGTNYKMVIPFLRVVDRFGGWREFKASGYMNLSIENLQYTDRKGNPVYSMAHYGEQNGDLMADPEMTFSVDRNSGRIEPLTYRNDYMGRYDEVYIQRDGQWLYSKRLRTSLDDFLWMWLKNIGEQGFSPASFVET